MRGENERRSCLYAARLRRKAFTLIELLVVISILALLISILLPTAQSVRKQAQSAACRSKLHQWSLVLYMYTSANDDRFFKGIWTNVLRPWYIDDKGMLLCPIARRHFDRDELPTDRSSWKDYGDKYRAWVGYEERGSSRNAEPDVSGSFGFNYWVTDFKRQLDDEFETLNYRRHWKTASIRHSANTPVLTDCVASTVQPFHEFHPPPDYDNDIWVPPPTGADQPWEFHMKRLCIDRHQGKINGLFLDWSTRPMGLKEMWTFKWHREFNTAGPWTKAGGVAPESWPNWMRKFKDY